MVRHEVVAATVPDADRRCFLFGAQDAQAANVLASPTVGHGGVSGLFAREQFDRFKHVLVPQAVVAEELDLRFFQSGGTDLREARGHLGAEQGERRRPSARDSGIQTPGAQIAGFIGGEPYLP